MEVIYLGYKDINFRTDDGRVIDGIKISYYFPASSNNAFGMEVGSYFFDRSKAQIINTIKNLKPLSKISIDLVFNGKSTQISNIHQL